jgi:hypothetical protein
VVHLTLTYLPGANSGWHAHPGFVLAVVKEGTVCQKLIITQIAPACAVGPEFREDLPKPRCRS